MNADSMIKFQMYSDQYYDYVNKFVKSDYEDCKILGKFYTNFAVAETMAADLLSHFIVPNDAKTIKIIDPFCGDGRLIHILLIQMACCENLKNLAIETVLWDVDEKAVLRAKSSLEKMCKELLPNVSVRTATADTFVIYASEVETFDICITNPPWGLLKPQKIFNNRCTQSEIEDYKKAISLYDDFIRSEFSLSQPTKKFGRWGSNLGRTGVEVALRLVKKTGLCGVVSPSSLFNDQVSVPLRQWIFEEHKILELAYYPAEMKLFGSADVSSIAAVFGNGKTTYSFKTKFYNTKGEYEVKHLTIQEFEYIKRNQYSLPLETGYNTIGILQHLENYPTVEEICKVNNLHFSRELDETRINEKLVSRGNILFVKGYMVNRYAFKPEGLFVNEDKVVVPQSVTKWKIVWRDVSRSTQKRRMMATILAPGCIAGNSLGVIYADNEKDLNILYVLLAVMNSMVFEFQARSQLVSNHVAAGIIKQIHIPNLKVTPKLYELVQQQLNGSDFNAKLEAIVAKMYGVTLAQFMAIAENFNYERKELYNIQREAEIIYGEV